MMGGKQERAYGYALLAVGLWSTVAAAFKIALRHLNVVELVLVASVVSSACLFLILLRQGQISRLRSLTRRDILFSMAMGLLNPFFYYLILFKAYDLLPAQQAQPINLVWGLMLSILAVPILKQRLKWRTLCALLVSFIGVIIISTEGNFSYLEMKSPLGVGLALSSSLLWALYWLLNTKDRLEPLVRLFLNCFFGAIYAFFFLVIFFPIRVPAPTGLLAAVYAGIFEMGITFYVWLKALKLSDSAAKISILIYIMPFISLVFIHFLLGERILPASVLGLLLIVGAITWEKLGDFKKGVH